MKPEENQKKKPNQSLSPNQSKKPIENAETNRKTKTRKSIEEINRRNQKEENAIVENQLKGEETQGKTEEKARERK